MQHYSIDIFGNYNKVYQQLNSHINGLNDLILVFKERFKENQNLSASLKNLSEFKNPITTFESLSEGISAFKGDMYNQYNYLSEFLISLKDEIITPLSKTKQTFLNRVNKNFQETLSINKLYQSSVNQLELSKNKFHSTIYLAEQSKLKSEFYKKKLNNIKDNNNETKEKYINGIKE